MTIAEALIAAEQGQTILVIGAEKLSTITDMTDRSTAILFGDAAGAAIIQRVEGGDRGILSTFIKSDGKLANLLYRPGGGSADPIGRSSVGAFINSPPSRRCLPCRRL
jgi:3-oxoacyl-[acyl-carrier-protein] synthase-3